MDSESYIDKNTLPPRAFVFVVRFERTHLPSRSPSGRVRLLAMASGPFSQTSQLIWSIPVPEGGHEGFCQTVSVAGVLERAH